MKSLKYLAALLAAAGITMSFQAVAEDHAHADKKAEAAAEATEEKKAEGKDVAKADAEESMKKKSMDKKKQE